MKGVKIQIVVLIVFKGIFKMNTYSISDMDGFIESIRNGAAESISPEYTEDLDDFITLPQVKQIVLDRSIGIDEDGNYMITEGIFDTIFENIRDTIYQSGLSKLASKGIIECAWDDESNGMIFWINSKTQGQKKIDHLPNYD